MGMKKSVSSNRLSHLLEQGDPDHEIVNEECDRVDGIEFCIQSASIMMLIHPLLAEVNDRETDEQEYENPLPQICRRLIRFRQEVQKEIS